MNSNSDDLALFKLAGDTADLMVSQSSHTGIASQNLHSQLDIPERGSARSIEAAPALRSHDKNRIRIISSVGQPQDSPAEQYSTDPSRKAVTAESSSTTAMSPSHLSEPPVKKKRGRPPKVRPQERTQLAAASQPAAAPALPIPEVVFAHRSQLPSKRIDAIPNPALEAISDKASGTARSNIISSFKSNTEGSTRLAADGISYRQLAGTREYRKRHESESGELDHSSAGILKRKYRKKDRHTEIIRSKNYCKSHVQSSQAEPEQRTKRQYIKRSSKWKNLTQSSQLREEMFLRAPNRYDSAIRATATRHDSTRPTHILPHLEDAYAGVPIPGMMHHDAHMAHMGIPPPGHIPGYPIHHFMPQYMPMHPMHHPYAFGRYGYDYGPPPSVTSMFSPHDGDDPYSASHPGMPVPLAFMHHASTSQVRDSDQVFGRHHPAAPVPRVSSSAGFRQQSSLGSIAGKAFSNPIPDVPSHPETLSSRRSTATVPGGSLRRNRISSDGRSAQFVEVTVPNQPANAIALLPPLTETSAFRHISKNHDEVTAQRRRRHKLDKLVSGKPVSATSENGSMLSQPPVSLARNDSDVYDLRQIAPCTCKWTRSSYEQVLAQADSLLLSTIAQGKSFTGTQDDLAEPAPPAPLVACLSEPASDSAVSFALKLQREMRSPEAVQEFISATLTLLKREMGSLNRDIASYSKASEKFHETFESDFKQAVSALNACAPIPEEFFSRILLDPNANSGEAAGRENKKVLWELFHQKMSDIVVAKNGLDIVTDGNPSVFAVFDVEAARFFRFVRFKPSLASPAPAGMKSIHKMGKSLPGPAVAPQISGDK